jgi:NAD+ diphosphatase
MHDKSIYNKHEPAVSPPPGNDIPSNWFVFSGNNLLVINEERITIPFSTNLNDIGLSPVRTQFLGTLDGQPCYCAEVAVDSSAPDGMSYRDLRSLYGQLDDAFFQLAGKAIQIVAWDQTHQYCSRCGTPMENLKSERAKKCPACSFVCYPRISPATITAIFKGNKILLAHAKHFPDDMYSLIAGFLEPGETLEDCVRREIKEEVNIRVKNIKYWGSQPWPYPNSMMIGFSAEYESGEICVDDDEIEKADWFDIDTLPDLPSDISIARKIIDWYVKNQQLTDG